MATNPYDHRPITFNGVGLPPAMMGVTIIEGLVSLPGEASVWLWRFSLCKGVEKSTVSESAIQAATIARRALQDHPDIVLAGLAVRLPEYKPEEIYQQWLDGFTMIIQSASQTPVSHWSAPGELSDLLGTPQKQEDFFQGLNQMLASQKKKDSGPELLPDL